MIEIDNSATLSAVFGHWPSFRDARLLDYRPQALHDDGFDVALELEVTEPARQRDEHGRFPETRVRVILHLTSALPSPHPDRLRLGAFGDLTFAPASVEDLSEAQHLFFGPRRWKVRWQSTYGDDISLCCNAVAVGEVERRSRAL